MKNKYTRKQICEAIKYWKDILNKKYLLEKEDEINLPPDQYVLDPFELDTPDDELSPEELAQRTQARKDFENNVSNWKWDLDDKNTESNDVDEDTLKSWFIFILVKNKAGTISWKIYDQVSDKATADNFSKKLNEAGKISQTINYDVLRAKVGNYINFKNSISIKNNWFSDESDICVESFDKYIRKAFNFKK